MHEKIIRSRKLRVDTTIVESNIHYPTDAHLLADAVRTIAHQAKKIRKIIGNAGPTIVDHSRSAKKRILAIGKLLMRHIGDFIEKVRDITDELADKTIETVLEAKTMLDHVE